MKSIQFDRVADLYDSYVDTDFDIPFFVQKAKLSGGKVLELTSGTGRVSIPLLREGVDLTCIDHSAGMLALLREKTEKEGLQCNIVVMDMSELSLNERYNLIFIPFNSFSEILDPELQRRVLLRIRTHLADDGEFVCTLHNERVRLQNIDGRPGTLGRFPLSTGGSLVVRYHFNYDNAAHIAHGFQYYEIYDQTGRMIGERSLEINFYLFTKNDFESMVRSCGFEVAELYGDYANGKFEEDSSPFMIWTLRKSNFESD